MKYYVNNGLATLDSDSIIIRNQLENIFIFWSKLCNSTEMIFPPLLKIIDLTTIDYFDNFPHLALIVNPIDIDSVSPQKSSKLSTLSLSNLKLGDYALPSAACYNIYFHLRSKHLDDSIYITTSAQCFRNEDHYDDLKRLWGFSMREIVCIGSSQDTQEHLSFFKAIILDFAHAIKMPVAVEYAIDPFFDKKSSRAISQRVMPVKEELIYKSSAIASFNFHRNFFGERCQIYLSDGSPAFSACVAFGIERWIYAILDHFQGNIQAFTQSAQTYLSSDRIKKFGHNV